MSLHRPAQGLPRSAVRWTTVVALLAVFAGSRPSTAFAGCGDYLKLSHGRGHDGLLMNGFALSFDALRAGGARPPMESNRRSTRCEGADCSSDETPPLDLIRVAVSPRQELNRIGVTIRPTQFLATFFFPESHALPPRFLTRVFRPPR